MFLYCDLCATALKLPELATRSKDNCENCGAENVECNHGANKDKPKKAAAKAAPKAKAKPKAAAKAKPKAKGKGSKK